MRTFARLILAAACLALWPVMASAQTSTGTKTLNIIDPGTVYGSENLNQLDLRASKRFNLDRYRFRVDADLYNALNNDQPYTVNTTFSTGATSAWLRPTIALQGRFFKTGGRFTF
jgi:hypothetical protein